MELWYFDYKFGGWEKLANQEKVLRRERITPQQWRKISVSYYPQLSVFVEPTGYAKPVRFRIPGKPDPSHGRPADTETQLKTETHILGLDKKPQPATTSTSPATQSK